MGGGGGSRQRRKAHDSYTQSIKTSSGSLPLFNEDECADFTLTVRLLNPRPALNNVVRGDVLTVQLDPKETLVVLNNNGEVCGNVAHPKAPMLISCIKKGNKFSAPFFRLLIMPVRYSSRTLKANICCLLLEVLTLKNVKSR